MVSLIREGINIRRIIVTDLGRREGIWTVDKIMPFLPVIRRHASVRRVTQISDPSIRV